MPTSAPVYAPAIVTVDLHRLDSTRLPQIIAYLPEASVRDFRPVIFSAQVRSTSELLRFL